VERIKYFLLIALLMTIMTACGAPTQVVEPGSPGDLPRSEAEVPRVSIEEAKAAFDSGAAIFLDVRSTEAYAASHVPGASSIPLDEIETNPASVDLDKEQWIITYCT
jgi:hypothetical protein